MEKREIKTITFYPKIIIEYVQKKGFITYVDLGKDFGYTDEFAQMIILGDMEELSLLTVEDEEWEYIEEKNASIRKYKLTEQAKNEKPYEGPIVFTVGTLPVIAKLTQEIFNEVIGLAEARGMELTEIAELNPTKFQEMVDRIRLTILNEYSPEELRELAIESKIFPLI